MSFWSWIWPINHLNTLTPSSLVLIRTTLEQSPKLCTNYGKHSPMDLVIKDFVSTLSIMFSFLCWFSRSVNDNVRWGNNHRPLRCKCQCQPDLGCGACARSTRRNSHWTQAASSERRASANITLGPTEKRSTAFIKRVAGHFLCWLTALLLCCQTEKLRNYCDNRI